MIVVSRLNGSQFAVNPDLIERVQASPDTTLVMVDGAKFVVTETITEVIDRIAAFRARILTEAAAQQTTPRRAPSLGLVPSITDSPSQRSE